jgi:catechol 2,3-dioxygenase-like lactoylglutathione lyase family enzyme
MEQQHAAVAILPAHDLDESQAFFERLGFAVASRYDAQGYRILRARASI